MKENKPGLKLLIYEYIKGILMAVLLVVEANKVLLNYTPDFYKNALNFLSPFLMDQLREYVTWHMIGFVINVFLFGVVFLIFRMGDKWKWMRLVVTGALLVVTIGSVFWQYELYRISIAAVLLYTLEGIVHWLHSGKEHANKLVLSILPFVMLPVLVSFVGKTSEEPLSWQWVIDAWQIGKEKMAEGIYNLLPYGESDEFSLELAGFNNEDQDGFWGSVLKKRSGPKLYIEKLRGRRGDGYLIGAIRDIYTGDGFVKENDTEYSIYNEYLMNYYEILYNLYYSGLENPTPYKMYAESLVEITYGSLDTTSVFYPSVATMFGDHNSKEFDQNQKYQTRYLESEEGRSYRMGGVMTNMQNEALRSYLRQVDSVTYPRAYESEQKMDEDTWRQTLLQKEGNYAYVEFMNNSVHNETNEEIMEFVTSGEFAEYLMLRRDIINERDLQLPNSLPNRVTELAQAITQDEQSDYDKVMAIKDYLKEFAYTTDVDNPNRKEDFVDYFLFENREGYCVHFAASATVLLRCAGIPARYVEGFKANFREMRDDKYLVRSGNAHAWCEAYLEGYGWITVDASPGYGSAGSAAGNWLKPGVGPGVSGNGSESTSENSLGASEDGTEEGQAGLSEEWLEGLHEVSRGYYVGLCVGVFLLIGAAVITIKVFRRKIRYDKASTNEKVRIKIRSILKYLEILGLGIRENETLLEYRNRLKESEWKERIPDSEILNILVLYEEILYRGRSVNEDELTHISCYEKELKKHSITKYVLAFFSRSKYNLL